MKQVIICIKMKKNKKAYKYKPLNTIDEVLMEIEKTNKKFWSKKYIEIFMLSINLSQQDWKELRSKEYWIERDDYLNNGAYLLYINFLKNTIINYKQKKHETKNN